MPEEVDKRWVNERQQEKSKIGGIARIRDAFMNMLWKFTRIL